QAGADANAMQQALANCEQAKEQCHAKCQEAIGTDQEACIQDPNSKDCKDLPKAESNDKRCESMVNPSLQQGQQALANPQQGSSGGYGSAATSSNGGGKSCDKDEKPPQMPPIQPPQQQPKDQQTPTPGPSPSPSPSRRCNVAGVSNATGTAVGDGSGDCPL